MGPLGLPPPPAAQTTTTVLLPRWWRVAALVVRDQQALPMRSPPTLPSASSQGARHGRSRGPMGISCQSPRTCGRAGPLGLSLQAWRRGAASPAVERPCTRDTGLRNAFVAPTWNRARTGASHRPPDGSGGLARQETPVGAGVVRCPIQKAVTEEEGEEKRGRESTGGSLWRWG